MALLPITYDPPAVSATTQGLYGVVNWVQNGTEPTRFIDAGVEIRYQNYGLDNQFGVWGEQWCIDAESIATDKVKDRTDPDDFLDAFTPMTVFAWDHNYCGDMSADSRSEVSARAAHALDLTEPVSVETTLAARLSSDAGTPASKSGLLLSVSYLEGELAKLGLTGYIHAGAQYASLAASLRLDFGGRTPLGHKWVYGGGYVAGLDDVLVVTTQPVGWRSPAVVRDTIQYDTNQYVAVAERTLVIGYEAVLAAVTVG